MLHNNIINLIFRTHKKEWFKRRALSVFNMGMRDISLPTLTSLKLHVKSDTGITLNGSTVSQWSDQSGNENHLIQSTAIDQPVYETNQLNGRPALKFTGSNVSMRTLPFTLNQPTTVFIVLKQNTWGDGGRLFDGTDNNGAIIQYATTPDLVLYANAYGSPASTLPIGNYGLITAIFKAGGTNSILQINNDAEVVSNVGNVNMGGFTLAAYGMGGFTSIIDVCEVIIQGAEATAAERTAVKTYVTSKYGI